MAKIRTTEKVGQLKDGTMAYVSREMTNFNQDKKKGVFVSIIQESFFDFEEQDEMVYNEETLQMEATGGKVQVRVVKELKKPKAYTITYDQVRQLFTQSNRAIELSDDFIEAFDVVQSTSLLIDTNSQGFYNDAEWVKDSV